MENVKCKIKNKAFMMIVSFTMFSFSLLYGAVTPFSLPFSNSYLQRSSGVEALYWNPARIHNIPTQRELMFLSPVGRMENNTISVDIWNKGQEAQGQFTVPAKNQMMRNMNDEFYLRGNVRAIIAGFVNNQWAFTTATNVNAHGNFDKRFLELLMFGIERYCEDEGRIFRHDNNNFGVVAYQDFSIGYGGFQINSTFLEDIPPIYFGASMSFLLGLANIESVNFNGHFTSTQDTLVLHQKVLYRSATLGSGFKLSFGLSSDIVKVDENHKLSVGFGFDNIFGNIAWDSGTEAREIVVEGHIKDLHEATKPSNQNVDWFIDEDETIAIGSYATTLPFIFRFGSLYTYNDFSASLDFAKNFGDNNAYNYDPQITMGFEYVVESWLPIQFGFRLPIGETVSAFSYGIGFRGHRFEYQIGYQSFGALFGNGTRGAAMSSSMRFRF